MDTSASGRVAVSIKDLSTMRAVIGLIDERVSAEAAQRGVKLARDLVEKLRPDLEAAGIGGPKTRVDLEGHLTGELVGRFMSEAVREMADRIMNGTPSLSDEQARELQSLSGLYAESTKQVEELNRNLEGLRRDMHDALEELRRHNEPLG